MRATAPLVLAALLLAGCSSKAPAATPTSPSPSPSPNPTASPSPSVDPAQHACQVAEDLLQGFVKRYGDQTADLNKSKQTNANFLKFVSRLNGLIADVKTAHVAKGYRKDRTELVDGLTKVKNGTLESLHASTDADYKAGGKEVERGHGEVTEVNDRLAADYFNCTATS